MTSEEDAAAIVAAHQELVDRIERSTSRMKFMSALTLVVGALLVVSYISQLLLPLLGTRTVTVTLDDPALLAGETVVLLLLLAWLYLAAKDYAFAGRMRRELAGARKKEEAIESRIAG